MAFGRSDVTAPLPDDIVSATLAEGLTRLDLDGARVLVLVPDATRSMPLPALFAVVHDTLNDKVAALDVLIALGTHQPMSSAAIDRHFGLAEGSWKERYPTVTVFNHDWHDPNTFADLGVVPAEEISELSDGMLVEDVHVRVNRLVTEYDACLVLGPVFPHEVVGFSGGDKYFFPGVSGEDVINASHWLGALITSSAIIGTPGITPVRELIHRAAARIPARRLSASVVVSPQSKGVHAVFVGDTHSAWADAAAVSAQVHVQYVDRPYRRVVSIMPPMYDDIWVAAKGMYKVDPIVADGGEVIIYAPHVETFSVTHDPLIRRVGYHCRDYFLAQANAFTDVARGVLAHSTHLRGSGTYDAATGVEECRITVTLATQISEADCRSVNLNWTDPSSVDIAALANDPDTLVIPKAGELLFRLRS